MSVCGQKPIETFCAFPLTDVCKLTFPATNVCGTLTRMQAPDRKLDGPV